MNDRRLIVSEEARERVRRLANRRLSPEEFDAYVSHPMSAAERDEILSLIRWFCRRYPTPADRLAYVHRVAPRYVPELARRRR